MNHQALAHFKRFGEVAGQWRDGLSMLHIGPNIYPADGDWR